MLIKCPSCETTYRVADDLITGPSPSFRCSRCKHIFNLDVEPEAKDPPSSPPDAVDAKPTESQAQDQSRSIPPSRSERPAEATPPESPRQEKLFGFGPAEARKAPEVSAFDIDRIFHREERPTEPPAGERRRPEAKRETVSGWSSPSPESSATDPQPSSRAEPDLDEESAGTTISEFEEQWERSFPTPEEEEAAASELEQPVSTIPYLTLFAVLLLAYSAATLLHQTRPSVLEGALKSIPWFGNSVFQNHHLRQRVVLESLRPSVETILGNREVFVVSGVAYNRNMVSIRAVQIEGRLFDAEGKDIGRQAIWVGNAMTPKIIKDLTAQEISILQKLSPQKRFEIPPQKGAAFVIVFFKPRREIKDFSCRIVSAEGVA